MKAIIRLFFIALFLLAGNPANAKEPLRVAFQKGAINLSIAKQRGLLEKRFGAVTWIEFPAGPQLLEALAVGAADFGVVGDSPPIFAQAAGKALVYVGAEPPKPDSSAVLVPKNSSSEARARTT
jgi:sulfonate transport system substrate-binding protein